MLDANTNIIITVETKEIVKTLSNFLNDIKPHLEKMLDTGILGPGINNLANEFVLGVQAVNTFFANVYKMCVQAISSAFTAIGSLSAGFISSLQATGTNAIKFLATPAGTVIAIGAGVLVVSGLAYFSYKTYTSWKERREQEKAKERILLEKQQQLDKIKQKVIGLIEQPEAIAEYFRKGTFVRELFSITGILQEEVLLFKSEIREILKSLREFGYGRKNKFYRESSISKWLTNRWWEMRRDVMGQKLPSAEYI
ncbi:hypothetical protein [Anabaena sp. UHCC 0399]|nr:hypothetical protein [Anabaena sp. UHCC 0399]MEA5568546.1 hypothetical protein [Anabaena sp. UHCC 0399]